MEDDAYFQKGFTWSTNEIVQAAKFHRTIEEGSLHNVGTSQLASGVRLVSFETPSAPTIGDVRVNDVGKIEFFGPYHGAATPGWMMPYGVHRATNAGSLPINPGGVVMWVTSVTIGANAVASRMDPMVPATDIIYRFAGLALTTGLAGQEFDFVYKGPIVAPVTAQTTFTRMGFLSNQTATVLLATQFSTSFNPHNIFGRVIGGHATTSGTATLLCILRF